MRRSRGLTWPPPVPVRLGKEINSEDSVYYWCYKNNIPVFCPALTDGSIGDMLYFHTYKTGLGSHLRVDIVEDIRLINDIAVRASPRKTGALAGDACCACRASVHACRWAVLAFGTWPRRVSAGVLILGGGLPKHHIFNANLMRNGADFCTVISTATEWDGSGAPLRSALGTQRSPRSACLRERPISTAPAALADSGARPDEAVSWGKIRMDATPAKVYGDATILFPLLVSQTFAKNWDSRPRQ